MQFALYLRDQAIKYRRRAEEKESIVTELELLELAAVCEQVATNIEDRLPSG